MAEWKALPGSKYPIAVPKKETFCETKKYDIMYDVPREIEKDLYVMNNCCHNEYVGLRNRYLKESKFDYCADDKIVDKVLDELADSLRPNFHGVIPLEKFFENKKGKLAKRYEKACQSILDDGFDLKHCAGTSAFVKNEIYDELKAPRMIINRDPRFNLAYGRYTIPLEDAMMKLPEVTKGKDFLGMGKQFKDKLFSRWLLECDFSKYESTQRITLLIKVELGLWKRLLSPEEYRDVETLFWAKMKKCGYTLQGVYFAFWSMRGSGDMDTGLFNTLLTWVACRYFEIVNKTGNRNFLVNGDDNIIGLLFRTGWINTFEHFGFDAKLILRQDYHDVDYCSGKFIQLEPGKFMYVQNFVKAIRNMAVFRKLKFSHCKSTYYHSLGVMYATIYPGIPLIENFANMLLRSTVGKHVSTDILTEINPVYTEQFRFGKRDFSVSNDIKIEICMSFDMSVVELDQLCCWLDNTNIHFRFDEHRRYRVCKEIGIRRSTD